MRPDPTYALVATLLTIFNTPSFIVFRASDVKDLQIEGPAPEAAPSDPAIVGVRARASPS